MYRSIFVVALCLLLCALMPACNTAPEKASEREALISSAEAKMRQFRREDPRINEFFNNSVGYAVFPAVGKGGFIVAGTYGRGVVYEGGRHIGYADITKGSLGLTAGGQGFSEIVFFQTSRLMEEFKAGKVALSAGASAVIVNAGASGEVDYEQGIAVFLRGESGAMLDASIGGQGFSYISKSEVGE